MHPRSAGEFLPPQSARLLVRVLSTVSHDTVHSMVYSHSSIVEIDLIAPLPPLHVDEFVISSVLEYALLWHLSIGDQMAATIRDTVHRRDAVIWDAVPLEVPVAVVVVVAHDLA